MLSRWFDSQRFLSDHPYLVCEETARYLLLWCFHLEAEQVLFKMLSCFILEEVSPSMSSHLHYIMINLVT